MLTSLSMGLGCATYISKHLDNRPSFMLPNLTLPMVAIPSVSSTKNNTIKNKTPNSQKSRTITNFYMIHSFTNFIKNDYVSSSSSFPFSFIPFSSSSRPLTPFLNILFQKPFGGSKQSSHPHHGREIAAP